MSAPNPIPSYQRERPRSVFGPILLVAIGIVLLLCTTGLISWRSFWMGFARYWPLVLILWGIAKLAEYLMAKQKGYPSPRLGAGSIVFLVFFILFGAILTKAVGLNWSGIRASIGSDSDWDGFDLFGSGYEFSDNFSVPIAAAAQIKVVSARGDINVTASEDNQAHVFIHKTLHGSSQSDADRRNEATHPSFQQQGDIWILDLTGGDYQSGRFNLDLQLPRRGGLLLTTRAGNISVSGRNGNLEASTDHGNLSVEQITGDASLHVRRGNLTAKNVSGDVTVDGTVSDSVFSDIGGGVTLTGTYWGDMQMSHVAKPVHFTSSRTDLQFSRLDGDFNMEPDNLRANGIAGPFKLETRSKSVRLEDVSGDIHIDDRNASVETRVKGPLGNIDIANVHGEIDLTLPPSAGFQLSAQSTGGEIQSDFNVKVDNSSKVATAQGTVGKGGPEVRLTADHGTIQIRKQ